MSNGAPGPRPSQVTIGGWAIAVASAMLVVTVFDTMAKLHSVDTRDVLTRTLTSGSARDLGISVADALSVMRVALFVAGIAAVVTGILGIFVLQRHATARIVLTIAAVPVVITAPVAGGFLGVVIGGATVLLWSRPARDWFAGRAPLHQPPERPVVNASRPEELNRADAGPSWSPPTSPPSSSPPPTAGWGTPSLPDPSGQWPRPAYAPVSVSTVPPAVRVACIVTWVMSLLTAVLYLVIAIALLVDRHDFLRLVRENPALKNRSISDGELVAAVVAAAAFVVVWCVAACLLALMVWRRRHWAWILLLVSVGFAVVVEIISLPYSLVHLAAAITALRLLLVAPTRAWLRGNDGTGSAGPRPPGPMDWAPPDPRWHQPSQEPPHEPAPDSTPPAEDPSGKPPVW